MCRNRYGCNWGTSNSSINSKNYSTMVHNEFRRVHETNTDNFENIRTDLHNITATLPAAVSDTLRANGQVEDRPVQVNDTYKLYL
jgi:hypothetical protein